MALKKKSTKTTTIHIKSINSTNNNSTGETKGNATCQTPQTSSTTHKHTSHLSHSWKPTSSPKPSGRTPRFYVYDYYDARCIWFAVIWCVHGPCIAALHVLTALTVPGCVHVCLHFAVGVGLFRDVCMFACTLLLALDCSGMCACLPALCCWRWIVPGCVHVCLHFAVGVGLFRDVCMFACTLLLALDCSGMCACLPALCCWRWIVPGCVHVCLHFAVGAGLSGVCQSSWIWCYINVMR